MAEEKSTEIIGGPEWDPEGNEWVYTLAREEDVSPWSVSVRGKGEKVVLMVWRGDSDDPTNVRVAQSDPLDMSFEDNRETFYESVVRLFGKRPWFREFLDWLSRNHDKKVAEKKEEEYQERLKDQAEYRSIANSPYLITPTGFVMEVEGPDGEHDLVPISNFTVRVLEELVEDDGSGEKPKRFYRVETRVGKRTKTFEIEATELIGMLWIERDIGVRTRFLGPAAKNKSLVRDAIKAEAESAGAPEIQAFSHTGWRELDGRWGYLHSAEAIFGFEGECVGEGCSRCQDCRPFEGRVSLRGKLARRALPPPVNDAELEKAVCSTFTLWELAADEIIIPLDAAAKRAALGQVDFSVYLVGDSGAGKTAMSLLVLNYFGAGLDEKDIISYEATSNAIEKEMYQLKDQVHVLDDFYDPRNKQRRIMQRIFREAANNSGRDRLRPDHTLEGGRPPRALVVSTGEHFPEGESLSARVLVIHVPKSGGVDFSPGAPINDCQQAARAGVYARAMSGFIASLATRYADIQSSFAEDRRKLMQEVQSKEQHARTPGIYADLMLGLKYWLAFALSIEAIDDAGYEKKLARGERAIRAAIGAQAGYRVLQDPVERFSTLLEQALNSGKVHLTDPTGPAGCPKDPEQWGWRKVGEGYTPQGPKLGWVLDDGLYLFPEASLEVAKKLAARTDTPLDLSSQTMNQRLYDRGLLLSTDLGKSRGLLTIRKRVRKEGGTFLHLKRPYLQKGDNSDNPDKF